MKRVLKTAFVLLLASQVAFAQRPAEIIPGFEFLKLDNTRFTDKNLAAGKQIFIVFFDVECDHCHHAIEYINKNYNEFKKAAIYLVTQDEQEKVIPLMAKYGPDLTNKKNVTILKDYQKVFITKFTPRKYPSIFLYSPQKKLIMYDDNEKNLFRFSSQINATDKK